MFKYQDIFSGIGMIYSLGWGGKIAAEFEFSPSDREIETLTRFVQCLFSPKQSTPVHSESPALLFIHKCQAL